MLLREMYTEEYIQNLHKRTGNDQLYALMAHTSE